MPDARPAAVPPRAASRPLWLTLALWTVPALVFLLAAGLWLTAISLRDLSDSAYDRSLAGAIRAIDLNVSTKSGGVGVELPYPLFESFETTASGEVYFRISTDDGLVQIGDALLPSPPALAAGEIRFYDATFFGRAIRLGAYKRPLDRPLYGASKAQNILIEVAETTGSREAFRRSVIERAVWRDVLAVLVAFVLLALGVRFALRPLATLKHRLDQRDLDDRSRLDAPGLPSEVHAVVDAVNDLMERHGRQGEAQRRFIDDASHQLKTPIAVLRSQVDYALMTDDPRSSRQALEAMRPVIDRAARMTTQFLSLARARNAALLDTTSYRPINVARLLDEVARLHLGPARRRRLEMAVELPEAPLVVFGSEQLLFEALSNLVDNAVKASGDGGGIVLAARESGRDICLEVHDEGAGMSDRAIEAIGERFRSARPSDAHDSSAGLGLSIVAEIAKAHGGILRVVNRPQRGLAAGICIPARRDSDRRPIPARA